MSAMSRYRFSRLACQDLIEIPVRWIT
jgi:hypothetical protein